jgi:hypothetical protein
MSTSSERPSKDQRKASANRHFTPGDRGQAVRSESERAQAALRAKTERLKALRLARDVAAASEAPPPAKTAKRK